MSRPKVSIIICTRNRAGRLPQTLDALAHIRTRHPWELILVDNASTDATADVIRTAPIPVRHLLCERIGLGAARDLGWRHAEGGIVSFTDDDCYLQPDFVDMIVTVFEERPDLGCVGGRVLQHNPAHARCTIKESDVPEEFPAYRFLRAGAIHGANVSFRRRVLEVIDGFDSELGTGTVFKSGEDTDVVAASIWAGFPARYDPRPTVRHDHGRLAHEVPKLRAGYDTGRGAYYAKYIARPGSRMCYLKSWWHLRKSSTYGTDLAALGRELRGAAVYLSLKRRYGVLAVVAPVALAAVGAVAAKVVLNRLGRALSF